jgi:uncharacterized membrane protein YhiD involved in acid resistance
MPYRVPFFRFTAGVLALLVAGFGFAYAFLQSVDWSAVAKTWGPLGVVFVVALIVFVGGLRFLKSYLTRKDAEANKLVTDTIDDARKERDAGRQLLKEQATEFVAHIKQENEEFRTSLRDVVRAFERDGGARKR